MREFKFRAWDSEKEEMAAVISIGGEDITLQDDEGGIWDSVAGYIDYPMQYTGLKDMNGVEVYEGDILTANRYPFQDEGEYNYHVVIEWIDDAASFFMTKRLVNRKKNGISDGISEPIEDIEDFEVIGNIYENPELLEGEAR